MIVGATFSETPYKIRTVQTEHYLRCGADILLNGLQQTIEGEAKCVVCARTVRLNMSKGNINTLDPETAILHLVEIPISEGKIRIECETTHLFDTEKCLRSWMTSYTGKPGTILRPQEFLNHLSQGGTAKIALGTR